MTVPLEVPDPPAASEPAARTSVPRAARLVTLAVRRLLHLFFLRIEVVGLERVPSAGGGVLVAWHPNGLLDPALILAHFPRRVVFGARHGLLAWPVLGRILRVLGTVPIYRPQDAPRGEEAGGAEAARREANRRSLDALAEAVAGGSFAALFPEGDSHDQPHLLALRPGAARLYLRASELAPAERPRPVLLPVGLHYNRKNLFGSKALVEFHPPVELPAELVSPPAGDEERRARERALTARIEAELEEVVQTTESWEIHHLMHRLRKLMRAERSARGRARPGPPSLHERVLGLARVRRGYLALRRDNPRETARLEERVRRYDRMLTALDLEDHELDAEADLGSPWKGLALVARAAAVYLALPPLLVLGAAVNTPVALGLGAAGRRLGAKLKDEATLKLLLGAVVFPLVWLVAALLVARGAVNLHQLYPHRVPAAPWLAGVVTFLLCSVGGWEALRYLRLAAETYHALKVRLTRVRRRRTLRRLLRERALLFESALALSEGLELPGAVAADGRITAGGRPPR